MKRARRALCLLLALAMAFTLLACGGGGGGTTTPAGGTSGGGESEKRDAVTLCISDDLASFDPMLQSTIAQFDVMNQMYDRIVRYLADGTNVPELAETWDISDDGLTYTFHIRSGVKFHNGDDLTAEDVAYSILRTRESPYTGDMLQGIADAVAPDANTVVVTMESVDAAALMNISNVWVVDKAYMESVGDGYDDAPVGSGPYQFVSYVTGDKCVLTRFDDYWQGAPDIKDVTYRQISDVNTATISIQTGDINYGRISQDAYDNVVADPNLTVQGVDDQAVNFFIFNTKKEPFDDTRVRQALSRAVDKQFIVDSAANGQGTPATSLISPSQLHDMSDIVDYWPYDPGGAAAALADAGREGLSLTIKTVAAYETVASVVQQNFKEVGVTANIELVELNTLLADMQGGDFDGAILRIALEGDPSMWAMVLSSGAGFNLAGYESAEVDALFAQAAVTLDEKARVKVFAQLFNTASQDAPYIPFFWPTSYYAYSNDLVIDDFNAGFPLVRQMHWK